MTEKRYPIEIPDGIVYMTKAQARAFYAQCEKIEAEKEPKQWRDGDIVLTPGGSALGVIYLAGAMHWLNGEGSSSLPPDSFRRNTDIHIGNLVDILTAGPILVAHKADEISEILSHIICCPQCGPSKQKLSAALAAYRENRKQE